MRYDTSELHTEIKKLWAENKRLRKQDQHREKIWKKRVAELEAKVEELEKQIVRYDSEMICPSCDLKTIRLAELEAENERLQDALDDAGVLVVEVENKRDYALVGGLRDVGEVHDSWNASDEFKNGWAACREQFRTLLGKEKDDE